MVNCLFDMQMTTYDMAALEELVVNLKPKHSLEVGSWKGLSSGIIARHTDVLYCVDTWAGCNSEPDMQREAQADPIFPVFVNNMQALGVAEKIKPLMMSSDEAKLIFKKDHLNFIYIDGDHSYEQIKKDLDWWDYLCKHGILAGHDYDSTHSEVMKAVGERFGSKVAVINKTSVWYIQKGADDV